MDKEKFLSKFDQLTDSGDVPANEILFLKDWDHLKEMPLERLKSFYFVKIGSEFYKQSHVCGCGHPERGCGE